MISEEAMSHHISDILSGIYSLEGLEDKAMIEGLIHSDEVFSRVTYEGVPDVRIIAYRGIPVMAMVWLPTRQSDDKANLHRGAVGVGIDIGNSKTLRGATFGSDHPSSGYRGVVEPHRYPFLGEDAFYPCPIDRYDRFGLLRGGFGDRWGQGPPSSRIERPARAPDPDREPEGVVKAP